MLGPIDMPVLLWLKQALEVLSLATKVFKPVYDGFMSKKNENNASGNEHAEYANEIPNLERVKKVCEDLLSQLKKKEEIPTIYGELEKIKAEASTLIEMHNSLTDELEGKIVGSQLIEEIMVLKRQYLNSEPSLNQKRVSEEALRSWKNSLEPCISKKYKRSNTHNANEAAELLKAGKFTSQSTNFEESENRTGSEEKLDVEVRSEDLDSNCPKLLSLSSILPKYYRQFFEITFKNHLCIKLMPKSSQLQASEFKEISEKIQICLRENNISELTSYFPGLKKNYRKLLSWISRNAHPSSVKIDKIEIICAGFVTSEIIEFICNFIQPIAGDLKILKLDVAKKCSDEDFLSKQQLSLLFENIFKLNKLEFVNLNLSQRDIIRENVIMDFVKNLCEKLPNLNKLTMDVNGCQISDCFEEWMRGYLSGVTESCDHWLDEELDMEDSFDDEDKYRYYLGEDQEQITLQEYRELVARNIEFKMV